MLLLLINSFSFQIYFSTAKTLLCLSYHLLSLLCPSASLFCCLYLLSIPSSPGMLSLKSKHLRLPLIVTLVLSSPLLSYLLLSSDIPYNFASPHLTSHLNFSNLSYLASYIISSASMHAIFSHIFI